MYALIKGFHYVQWSIADQTVEAEQVLSRISAGQPASISWTGAGPRHRNHWLLLLGCAAPSIQKQPCALPSFQVLPWIQSQLRNLRAAREYEAMLRLGCECWILSQVELDGPQSPPLLYSSILWVSRRLHILQWHIVICFMVIHHSLMLGWGPSLHTLLEPLQKDNHMMRLFPPPFQWYDFWMTRMKEEGATSCRDRNKGKL